MDPLLKSLDHHQMLRNLQPANQESTLSTRSIDKSTGQMLPAHWYLLMFEIVWSSDIDQHEDLSAIKPLTSQEES